MKWKPELIAGCIIGISIAGFLVVSWFLGHRTFDPTIKSYLIVLRHGFEGALVGGICDFIAVKSVYTAARDHFPSLRDNTTRIVIQDMVQVKNQIEERSDLNELLCTPKYQEQFVEVVQQFAPSQKGIETIVHNIWNTQIRPHLAEWMINYKFHGTAKQFTTRHEINTALLRQGAVELLKDVAHQEEDNAQLVKRVRKLASDITLHDIGVPSEPSAVRHLLEKLYQQWNSLDPDEDIEDKPFWAKAGHTVLTNSIIAFSSAIAQKVKTTTLEDAFKPLLTEETLKDTLISLAEKIEHPNQIEALEGNDDLLADIVSYWLVFVRAWEDLEPSLRTDIVDELIRIVETPALAMVVEQAWTLRMQLLEPDEILEREGTQAVLTSLSDTLKAQAHNIEQQSIKALQEQFDEMGQDNFVEMIRRNTQTRLDWIKVNGSGWGFVLGAFVGSLGLLLGH